MSQFIYFLLDLNLIFAGGIILFLLYGMFFSNHN